ncbi:endolysin amidase [Rhodococcus phage Mbo2]|uniref:Endolysin amidase n=1 Tax=Rhodococcus phage Mbo2 TaxID=2936911 RepID=A0A9E7LBL8_9CAUD|nr:endolysin amidase [Rhodococcus phage Mbo2]
MLQEIDRTGETGNHSNRFGTRIRLFVLHTSEGGKRQTPEDLHQWMKNNSVSYHYIAGAGKLLGIVDTDRYSWSCLDANPYTINLVYAGSQAAMSRQEWIDRFRPDIRNTAEVIVRDARKYNYNPRLIDWDAVGRGETGTTDHYGITMGLGIGDHTDVGHQYPFDLLRQDIEDILVGAPVTPPAPAPNAIAELRKLPGFEWLGGKVTQALEESINDAKGGKFVEYENGWIYWTAGTGAVAIPRYLFEVYADHGFERGQLGYPLAGHGVEPGGEMQAFEGGAIYRKGHPDNPAPGFVVHGAIGAHYRASGFERGPLGFPTSDEYAVDGGDERAQDFENGGRIVWSPNGTTALRAVGGPDQVIATKTH